MKIRIILLSLLVLFAISCQNEKFTLDEDLSKESIESTQPSGLKSVTECNTICDNCVMYVVCKLRVNNFPPLPPGVDYSSYSAKLGLINTSPGYRPVWGDIAIIDTDSEYGHVAFVEWRNPWSGQIFISESNWNGNCVSWRSNGIPGLKGYYHPQ